MRDHCFRAEDGGRDRVWDDDAAAAGDAGVGDLRVGEEQEGVLVEVDGIGKVVVASAVLVERLVVVVAVVGRKGCCLEHRSWFGLALG